MYLCQNKQAVQDETGTPRHFVIRQAIDAALACFRHPHYDLVDCLLDFLLTVHHHYGPQTRAAAQQFLKAANAYAFSHDD